MKILVLSGSRNRQGKTALAIDSIRKGVIAASRVYPGEIGSSLFCSELGSDLKETGE